MESREDLKAVRALARPFAATWPTIPFDEFVQEARIRLPRFRLAHDPGRRSWETFRNTCVCNLYRDMARRERYRLSLLRPFDERRDRNVPSRVLSAERSMTRREAQLDLLRAILRLTSTESNVLQLMLMGSEDEEIARLTGRSVAAVQTARSRALPRLRGFLAGHAS